MSERLHLKGQATSSQEQDALAESTDLLFEKLQAEEQAKTTVQGLPTEASTLSAQEAIEKEFQLHPRDLDARGAALNVRLSPNPATDALPVVSTFRRRRSKSYRSPRGWRKRNQLDSSGQ